jgi:hypothetical protein
MTNVDRSTVTVTIRLPRTVLFAMTASRIWLKRGFRSRNAWLESLITAEIDMRTVPTQARFDRQATAIKPRRGQL